MPFAAAIDLVIDMTSLCHRVADRGKICAAMYGRRARVLHIHAPRRHSPALAATCRLRSGRQRRRKALPDQNNERTISDRIIFY